MIAVSPGTPPPVVTSQPSPVFLVEASLTLHSAVKEDLVPKSAELCPARWAPKNAEHDLQMSRVLEEVGVCHGDEGVPVFALQTMP